MVALFSTEKNITPLEFEEFSKLFCRQLPGSLKDYFLSNNGGFPAEKDVEAGLWGLPINGFYSIKYGSLRVEDVINECSVIEPDSKTFGCWKKAEFVPFAYDSGGNPVFVSLREEDYESVYLYAMDGSNIFKVSTSFNEFLNRLYKSL